MLNLTKPASRKPFFITLIAVVIFIAIGALVYIHSNAHASITGWKAGRIIDDSIFTNSSSMSVAQIQTFLNGKVPTCDTNGQQLSEYGGPDLNGDGKVQRWEWGKQYYNQTTFPCLKDITDGGKKASQIIYDAAQEFKINPQVLIVLLQKEQALITDTWPLSIQYRSATGYGCPDTASCDSQYFGLTNQIRWAARMYRAIMDASPTWYTPYVLGNNYIQYNPSTSCGGSNVNIENRATQALYNYTPYQPNADALNAGWGAVNCGAYGNRNFYLYFSNWFGSPNSTATYGYSVVSLEAYSDPTYQTKILSSPITIEPNSTAYLKATVKNTGNQVWYKEFLRIGTLDPQDRSSIFSDSTWLGANRPTRMSEDSVAPGETASFLFKINTPADLGNYTESFGVLLEGQRWITGTTLVYLFTIASSSEYYQIHTLSFDVFSDSLRTKPLNDGTEINMYEGSKIYVTAKIKNTGNSILTAPDAKISASNPQDRSSVFSDESWLSAGRVGFAEEGSLQPGQTGTYMFSMTAPSSPGVFAEQFGYLIEGSRWISQNIGLLKINVMIRPPDRLTNGLSIQRGESLLSSDERYRLVFQGDGNLVLYSRYRAIWASSTVGKDGNRVVLQGDGNLVMYGSSGAIWNTKTDGEGASTLILQPDGNLVLYSTTGPTWNTRTNGKE